MDTQVIVVGAGPVGLMLAAELRLGGAEVTVLERLAAPTTESRASTLHARTMEILDQRGLLAALGAPPNDLTGHFGGLPLDLGTLPTRYPGQWKVPQAQVEALLADWASRLGAKIRREHELRGLNASDDAVRAKVASPAGTVTMTCGYLVGCDGENSTVRRLAGFEFPGTDATRELLHADVTGIEIPDRRFRRFPRGLATAVRRGDGSTRVMVHEYGRPALARGARLSFPDVVAAWARVTGEDISGGTPVWLHSRGDVSRQASRYRMGRVLLAGDAAHQQLPVGGQALNLGLQDAANLGWKLAAQLTGRAPAGLLDSYHAERHQVGRRVLDNIEAQTLLLLGAQDVEATRAVLRELLGHAAAQAHLGGMISGLDIRYERGDHPLTGARMPHLDVDTQAGRSSTTALLRAGRGVLLDTSAEPARRDWLGALAAPWAGRVELALATLAAGASARMPQTVLLRPDGYVAWAGDRAASPLSALDRWFGPATGQPARRRAPGTTTSHQGGGRFHVQQGQVSEPGR